MFAYLIFSINFLNAEIASEFLKNFADENGEAKYIDILVRFPIIFSCSINK